MATYSARCASSTCCDSRNGLDDYFLLYCLHAEDLLLVVSSGLGCPKQFNLGFLCLHAHSTTVPVLNVTVGHVHNHLEAVVLGLLSLGTHVHTHLLVPTGFLSPNKNFWKVNFKAKYPGQKGTVNDNAICFKGLSDFCTIQKDTVRSGSTDAPVNLRFVAGI